MTRVITLEIMNNTEKNINDILLVKYSDEYEAEWDEFVELRSKNSTFLHKRKFFNHNTLNKDNDSSFLFFKKNRILAVFPASFYIRGEKKILHSHQRSTYGGFVFSNECSINELDLIIKLTIEQAKAAGFSEVIIRPSFSIYHTILAQEQEYLLWKNGFKIATRELELAIDLRMEFVKEYSDATRRNIKKAARSGVSTIETDNIDEYWGIVEKNLAEKHNTKPVHTLKEVKLLREMIGNEKVRLFCAVLESKIIAGIMTFSANKKVIHAQYIASDSMYQDLRPLNCVIDNIAAKAKSEKFTYFNLGMVTEPGGSELNEGLCRFKEGFGARGVLRDTMHLILNY